MAQKYFVIFSLQKCKNKGEIQKGRGSIFKELKTGIKQLIWMFKA
jgi:hypothetical protein